jgi:hypothetical protein
MTTIAQQVQTDVNKMYRTAILDALAASNEPFDHSALSLAVLGGSIRAEVECVAPEPYVPAVCQLVLMEEVAYYRGEDGILWLDLWDRATLEQQTSSVEVRDEVEVPGEEGNTAFYDDPNNYRSDPNTMIEELQAARGVVPELPPELAKLLAGHFGSDDDEDKIVH